MSFSACLQISMIGVAGALGALARYLFGRFVAERTKIAFPLGTLLINITGAFLIGCISALVSRKMLSPALQLVLATGFLGGYTTFSTMSWEGTQLARGGYPRLSVFYFGSTTLLGLAAATLGLLVGGWL